MTTADVQRWVPACDIYETAGQDLVIEVDLPAIDRDALEVKIDGDRLFIRAERALDEAARTDGRRRLERRIGRFERTFTVPRHVDVSAVRAGYDAGVLRIELPTRAEARPRQIPVEPAA